MSAFGSSVEPATGVGAADWLISRLGQFGTAGAVVPGGFDTYVAVAQGSSNTPPSAPEEIIAHLASIASRHTSTPTRAWFAIWTGYGWSHSRRLVSTRASRWQRRRIRQEDDERSSRIESELSSIPRFELPQREYFLLCGPVAAASQIECPDGHGLHPPDLAWPEDKAWFIGSDTDLAWTYVAGTPALAEDINRVLPNRTVPVDWAGSNAEVGKRLKLP